jgi:heme exporter protein D
MNFDNFSDFLAMGGHGIYVWMAYGAALVIFVANVAGPVLKRKDIMKKHAQRLKREKIAS